MLYFWACAYNCVLVYLIFPEYGSSTRWPIWALRSDHYSTVLLRNIIILLVLLLNRSSPSQLL